MPDTRSRLTALSAFDAFAGGVGFVVGTPRVWGYAIIPAAMMGLLTAAFTALSIWGAAEVGRVVFGGDRHFWGSLGYWFVTVLLAVVLFLIAVVLALVLAEPLSGLALTRIAQAQEQKCAGGAPPSAPFFVALALSVRCVLFSVVLGGSALALLLAVSLFFPPAAIVTVPLKVLVLGWMLAWDFIDYSMCLRRQGLRARLKWVCRNFAAFTMFGLMWAMLVVVPGVVLLLLPMGVAGATRMVLLDDPRPTE